MQALMVSRRNHMFVIIKKGENVNVCIHDFDDVKRRIKQGSFCFKINTRFFQQTKPWFNISSRSSLASKCRDFKSSKAHVIDYQGTWKCVIDYTSYVIDYQRLWTLGIQILNERSQLFKKNNCVIDYTNSVIDYQRGFSRNIANSHIFSLDLWMAIKGL